MSRLIRKEGEAGAYEAWQVPEVTGVLVGRGPEEEKAHHAKTQLTAKQIEEIQEQARLEAAEQGYQEGYQQGLEAAQSRIDEQVRHLQQVMSALHQPFDELDEQVEEQLSQLAMIVARHLIRRELRTDPGQVIAVVREALAALPISSRGVRLHLHPEDAQLLRDAFSMNEQEAAIQILDDPLLSRGGCRVETETSQIDATVESRLNALIAQIMGGERQEDEQEPKA